MSLITILQDLLKKCYQSEHCFGIRISTQNNTGWYVIIDLFDTEFEEKDFKFVDIHRSSQNWVRCIKENSVFKGYGGVENLEDILHIFHEWIIT